MNRKSPPAPIFSEAQRTLWLPLFAILAVALALRAPIASVPIERDEGEYAYIAQRWLDGAVPYQDSFDQKPPGVFVAYAFIIRYLGGTPAVIHWAAQVYTLGTLALIFFLGRRLFSPVAGLVAGVTAAFMIADKGVLGNAANTETFMILPLTAGFLTTLWTVDKQSLKWAFVTGVCAGLAVLFKQVAATSFLFCFLYIVWSSPKRFRLGASMVLGVMLTILPVIGYFYAKGAIREFYDCVIGYNIYYSQNVPLKDYPKYFAIHAYGILLGAWPIYLFAAIGVVAGLFGRFGRERPAVRRAIRLVLLWLAFGFVAVGVGGVFRHHYFLQIVPAVALLAGCGTDAICAWFQALKPADMPPGLLPWGLAAAALLYGVVQGRYYYSIERPPESKGRDLYSTNPFVEAPAIGRYLAAHTRPNDTVLVFGSEPQIYYYAHRKCASRYIFVYPLMTGFPDTRARQASYLEEIRKQKPRYIVYVTGKVATGSFLTNPETRLEFFDEINQAIVGNYELAGWMPFWRIASTAELPMTSDPWTRNDLERVRGTDELALITDPLMLREQAPNIRPDNCMLRLFKLK